MTVSYDPSEADSSADTEPTGGVKDQAKAQAQEVASTTKDEAAAVVQTTKEQVQAVTADVRDQTMQLVGEASGQLMEHAGAQRDRAVSSLRSVGDELSSMAERADTSGLGVQLAREGGQLTTKVADYLEQREPGQLVADIRDLARRRPGAFLLGAAVAGLLVGRATRSARGAHKSDDSAGSSSAAAPFTATRPTTLPADYAASEYPTTDYSTSLDPAGGTSLGDPAGMPVTDTDTWGPGMPTYPSDPTTPQQPGVIQ